MTRRAREGERRLAAVLAKRSVSRLERSEPISYDLFPKGASMQLPPWLEDVREWYGKLWIAPQARGDSRGPRPVPGWLLALLPYLLVAAAAVVLLIAIAVKH